MLKPSLIIFLICCLSLLAACDSSAKSKISVASNNSSSNTGSGTSINIQQKIINSAPVDATTSPQIVAIKISSSTGDALCSGTVVAPQTVLTAGHCFENVYFRAEIQTSNGFLNVAKILVHPNYQAAPELGAIFNDLAILYVPDLNLPSLPILLSRSPQAGDIISTFGFGINQSGESGFLQNGLTKIAIATPNHLFTEPFDGEISNACNGDSGGPAILGFTDEFGNQGFGIVGLVSSGTQVGCVEGDITLYTNLQNQFILDFLNLNAPGIIYN